MMSLRFSKYLFRIILLIFVLYFIIFPRNDIDNNNSNSIELESEKFIAGTFYEAGGFGNQIWRFASLYGIGKTLNRQPYIESKVFQPEFTNIAWKRMNLTEIGFVFPSMYDSISILKPPESLTKNVNFADDCCQYDDPKKLLNITETYLKISGDYLQSYKFFHPYKNDIANLLECGQNLMDSVNRIADKMFNRDRNSKLCVHIRRGDFLEDIMLESTEDFVMPAIKYVHRNLKKKKHENVSLVFIGNDFNFTNGLKQRIKGFQNIYISNMKSRGEDLCFGINFCDSIILTASGSTFGWWMAYLMKSNGPVFYNSQVTDYGNHSKDIHDFDIFLPEWNSLTLRNGIAFEENKIMTKGGKWK